MPAFSATIDLSSLTKATGFKINGEATSDYSGWSVASAGDINGDGFDDVIIGAPYADPNNDESGAFYVIFGKAGGFANDVDLSALNGTNGFKINGEAEDDFAGTTVASAGDINGDGIDDLIIGARLSDSDGIYSGASYVVFGKSSAFSSSFDLTNLNGNNGFRISAETAGDRMGHSVASAGDINGDGIDDLIVGANFADPIGSKSGASYVIFGKTSGFGADFDLSTVSGTNGFQINGASAAEESGTSVASAGDINSDGYDDLIIGAPKSNIDGTGSGAAYVVFGKAGGFTPNLFLTTLDGTNGFRIGGEAAFNEFGTSVASAGDVNGDGFDDLIIGADNANSNGSSSGATYVIFGKAGGFTTDFDLTSLDGSNGFKINGEANNDASGHSVASAGDLNGDGFDDLIVGAYHAEANGQSEAGASYVIFGRAPTDAVTRNGTSTDNTIRGGTKNDTLNGKGGNDVLYGAGGKDKLNGGSGKDKLFGDNGDDILKGGDGDDKLFGNDQNDKLYGGKHADTLNGGSGKDKLYGEKGNDSLTGGNGKDKFIFAKHDDKDTITDFQNNKDKIDLSAFNFNSKSQALSKFLEIGNDHNDKLGFKYKGTEITVKGIDMGDLNGAEIII